MALPDFHSTIFRFDRNWEIRSEQKELFLLSITRINQIGEERF
jgi:hypothetical protein